MNKKPYTKLTQKQVDFLYKTFPIISVCREDIVGEGYDNNFIDSLDDSKMKYIADKMSNSFCDMDIDLGKYFVKEEEIERVCEDCGKHIDD